MANPLNIAGNLIDGGRAVYDFVFVKLPKKSIFPLVLLVVGLVLSLLYLVFWYTQLYTV